MPSTINAQSGNALSATALIKTAASDANLVLQTNGVNAIAINQAQNANCLSTGSVKIPTGTTAQRPSSPVNGMIRFNTTINVLEGYANNMWAAFYFTPTPTISVAPVISGSAVLGSNLTSTTGTWNYSPDGYYYQWYANSSAISSNATANVFTLTSAQVGANITCNVIAYNLVGNSTPSTSNTLGPVAGSYSVSYLMVAGGGGGGAAQFGAGGGGGAGGLLANSATVSSGTAYPIVIGGGGTGWSYPGGSNTGSGTSGSNSTALSVVAIGGGGGGYNGSGGLTGGSGGGMGGSGTSGQGYAGGNSGGGGAGQVGGNNNPSSGPHGGVGGNGVQSSITGTATYYAGGGAGSIAGTNPGYDPEAGGQGGGGYSASYGAGNGTANLGGGGGGAGQSGSSQNAGGSGGSGVVIISYASPTQIGSGGTVTSYSNAGTTYFVHKFTTSGTYTA